MKLRLPPIDTFIPLPTGAGQGDEPAPATAGPEPGLNVTQATSSPVEDEFPSEASGAKSQLGRFYSCLWTLFDYEQHLTRLRAYANHEKGPDYMVWGFETCPRTNRPHLQGYTHWANKRSIGAFSETFGNCWVHKPNASAAANRAYCLKIRPGDRPNQRWEEFGECPRQGQRADWSQAVEQLRTSVPVVEVINAQPHLLPTIRALKEYQQLARPAPKARDVKVIYIHGPTGTYKTTAALEAFPDAYVKPHGQWWDDYRGEKVVVLDEYYSDIEYATLLRVLDRHPIRVPYKGGFYHAEYDTVIITSNAHLDQQYPGILGHLRRAPLYRRIHCVIHATERISGEHITNALRSPPARPEVQVPKASRWTPSDPTPEGDAEPDDRELRLSH